MAWISFTRSGVEMFRQELRDPYRIGRGSACSVRLRDLEVSRHAADLVREGGTWTLLAPAPVVFNGSPLRRTVLREGDHFAIGPWLLRFHDDGRGPDDEADTVAIEPAANDPVPGLFGRSEGMRQVFEQVRRAARCDLPVLVLGETGTGKERVAQAVHHLSSRAGSPLIALNCAAVSATLFESELFGHRKGAFTGALHDHPGAFQRADRGSLMLDEIGELPLEGQAKLLRALETGEVLPVGGTRPVPVRARLIAATNRDLLHEVESGRFRADLRYRLWVLPIHLPPLRERGDDLALLAARFLDEGNAPGGPWRVTPAAQRRLRDHPWPGNVRELRNTLLRATVRAEGGVIHADDLDLLPPPSSTPSHRAPEARGARPESLEGAEVEAIRAAMAAHRGNRTRAAQALGIARSTLHVKLKQLEAIGEW